MLKDRRSWIRHRLVSRKQKCHQCNGNQIQHTQCKSTEISISLPLETPCAKVKGDRGHVRRLHDWPIGVTERLVLLLPWCIVFFSALFPLFALCLHWFRWQFRCSIPSSIRQSIQSQAVQQNCWWCRHKHTELNFECFFSAKPKSLEVSAEYRPILYVILSDSAE